MVEAGHFSQFLVVGVVGLLLIAASSLLGPRLRIAAPLLLAAIGIVASFLPVFATVHIDPDWILEGVLPPLLYSSAVSLPGVNFRREFGAISGLSVLLVVGTSLLLGLFFMFALPGIGFAWGVALGAIISPTDAVATSIVKQLPVSQRVVAILDGESLLNDATALVLLRTAIAATAATFSFWGGVGSFTYSVAAAVAVGALVGWVNLAVRRRISDPTVNTLISFTVPFLASVPATLLGASGLVAAVVAGLVTGVRAPRELSPENRLSDSQNWRMVELVLEGGVFLTMGLQIKSILLAVQAQHVGILWSLVIAAGALAVTILVRAGFVAPLLAVLAFSARRREALEGRVRDIHAKLQTAEGKADVLAEANTGRRVKSANDIDRFARRVTKSLADIEYFIRQPLGWREGTIVVWAGMRGAITVAAAQTLPEETPQRPGLVLIAFAVATLSLLIQGGTIGWLIRRIMPKPDPALVKAQAKAERARLMELLKASGDTVPAPAHADKTKEGLLQSKRYRLAVIAAQREALLDARDTGTFDADVLAYALANLDAAHITMAMRGGPDG